MSYFLDNFTNILCGFILFLGTVTGICIIVKTRNVGAAVLFGLHGAQIGVILLTFLYILIATVSLLLV